MVLYIVFVKNETSYEKCCVVQETHYSILLLYIVTSMILDRMLDFQQYSILYIHICESNFLKALNC